MYFTPLLSIFSCLVTEERGGGSESGVAPEFQIKSNVLSPP